MQWDFWSQCPESLHQVTILFSDRGIPASYRTLNGYGSHAYSFINADNERVWCKFHFKTNQGIENWMDDIAARTIGADRESHQRELFDAIESENFPSWTLKVQIMTQEQADTFQWNPFDLTKVWPHADFPLIEAGQMELNRNPENYHAEVEQVAFKPSAFIPGIGPSPCKVLQARLMSYSDTQHHRLGVNHHQIPVNKPRCPVMHTMRDGQAATAETYGSATNFWPSTRSDAAHPDEQFLDPAWDLGSSIVDRYDSAIDHDDYTQPGNLYRLFDDAQKDRLTTRIAGALGAARIEVQMLQLCHFFRADPDYGSRIASKLGIEIPTDMR